MNEIQLDFGIYEHSYRLRNIPEARLWRWEELSDDEKERLRLREECFLREKPYLAQALRRS